MELDQLPDMPSFINPFRFRSVLGLRGYVDSAWVTVTVHGVQSGTVTVTQNIAGVA